MVLTLAPYKPISKISDITPGGVDHPAGKGIINFNLRVLTRYGEVLIDFGQFQDLLSWRDSLSVEGASGSWTIKMRASLCNENLLKKLHPGLVVEAYCARNDDPLIGVIRDPSKIKRIDTTPKLPEFAQTQAATPGAISITPTATGGTADTAMTARRKAFLDTIAYSEGADYNVQFTGTKFSSFADHPRQIKGGGGFRSDAAGRYQFLSTTWDGAKKSLGLTDFSPENQDKAGIYLVQQRGALADVDAGNFEAAINKCALEWASFPGSPYGQPTHSMAKLKAVYEQALAKYGVAGAALPASPVAATPAGVATTSTQAVGDVIGPSVKPVEDPYLDKCPHLLIRGVIGDYGRSTDDSTSLTISGESYGAIYKDCFMLVDIQAPELASQSLEIRNSSIVPLGVSYIYYTILSRWVENFWGQPTGWEARTRVIPFPPNYITRINSEGSAWSNLQWLSIEGFFHIFVDHTGAICWEKLPWSSKKQSLIAGRNWEDLPILDLPSWKVKSWNDRLSQQGVSNFIRCISTQQGQSGGNDRVGAPALIYNMGSIRQYGGPTKREIQFPIGTDGLSGGQYYTTEPQRKQQASVQSFTSLCALECVRWYDRPVQRCGVTARGESAWRINMRVRLAENWHCPDAKPAEYYVVSRSHSINIANGSWDTNLELVRDRRTRYLGIGVGDVPIILDPKSPVPEGTPTLAKKTATALDSAVGKDAGTNAERFTRSSNLKTGTPIAALKNYKPPGKDGELTVVELPQYLRVPLVPDEYFWFDRLTAKIVPIGNDPHAYAQKEVIPNLGKESITKIAAPISVVGGGATVAAGGKNGAIMGGVNKMGAFSTRDHFSGGNVACVFAVNKVFKTAGIETPWGGSENVLDAENALKRVATPIPTSQVQPGDIAIFGDADHIGIALAPGGTSIRSNSSSRAVFAWDASAAAYDNYYTGGKTRFYRLK